MNTFFVAGGYGQPAPLTPDGLKALLFTRTEAVSTARAALAQAEDGLADVCARAGADDRLRAALWEWQHPPPTPSRPRPVEKTIRVKVVVGFSTLWPQPDGYPWWATAGSVIDIPAGLAAAAPQLFEKVDGATPVHRVEPEGGWPR